jgi:hypothetical protein
VKTEPKRVVPSDVHWNDQREITMYAIVPCRPTGYRVVERRCTLEEAIVFGGISERDTGELQVARVEARISKQAIQD